MQKRKRVSFAISQYALGLVLGSPLSMAGCGGNGGTPEMVVPAEPVNVSAKDSMDYYRDNMPQKAKRKK